MKDGASTIERARKLVESVGHSSAQGLGVLRLKQYRQIPGDGGIIPSFEGCHSSIARIKRSCRVGCYADKELRRPLPGNLTQTIDVTKALRTAFPKVRGFRGQAHSGGMH